MFRANGYPNCFFDKCDEEFLTIKAPQLKDKENVNEEKLFFSVPYVGKSSQLFTKQLSKLIANLTSVKRIKLIQSWQLSQFKITYSYASSVEQITIQLHDVTCIEH